MSSKTNITVFPQMECPGNWSSVVVPLGEGWHATMSDLLVATEVPTHRDRYTGRGDNRKPIAAKSCVPGVAPYLLSTGDRRCKQDIEARDEWAWVPLDLDAVPMDVAEVARIVRRAFDAIKIASWTTWSCRDGYASVRVMIPLTKTVPGATVADLWWWAHERLIDAGLPEDSAKEGEPANDSRACDGRLFYLPSAPEVRADGHEGWGGTLPGGYISPDDTPVLDPHSVWVEARNIRARREPEHLARWPGVAVPGGRRPAGSVRAGEAFYDLDITRGVGGGGGAAERVAGDEIPGSVRAVADAGGGRHDGCPWCGSTSSRVLSVLPIEGGRLLAYCFAEGVTRIEVVDTTPDPDADLVDDILPAGDVNPTPGPEYVDGPTLPAHLAPSGDALLDRADDRQRDLLLRLHGPSAISGRPTGSLLTDLFDGPTDHMAENLTTSIGVYREPSDTRGEISGDKEGWTVDTPTDRDLRAATWRFAEAEEGGEPLWCGRGPYLHAARQGSSQARSTRLPCGGYDCPVCGPRKITAWEAAAETVLRHCMEEGDWAGYTFAIAGNMGDTLKDNLRRWVQRGAGTYIATAPTPDRTVVTLIHEAGSPPKGSMWRHLVRYGAECLDTAEDIVAAVCGAIRATDRMAWHDHTKRANPVRSRNAVTSRIVALRARVLGKGNVVDDPEMVAHVSYTPTSKVMELASDMVGVSTEAISEEVDARRASKTRTWQYVIPEIHPAMAIARLKLDGEEAHVRAFDVPTGEFVDLDLSGIAKHKESAA